MSAPEISDDISQKKEGQIEPNLIEDVNEEEKELPPKTDLDGSDKQILPFTTSLAGNGEDSDRKYLKSSDPTQNTKETGSGDNNLNIPDVQLTKSGIDVPYGDAFSNTTSMSSSNTEVNTEQVTSIALAEKSSFLETGTSLAGEDHDRESQDEDLVLKWDDDDEENADISIADDETKGDEATPDKNELTTKPSRSLIPSEHATHLLDNDKAVLTNDDSHQPPANNITERTDTSIVINSVVQNTESKSVIEAMSDIIKQEDTMNKNDKVCEETIEKPTISLDTQNNFVKTMEVNEKDENEEVSKSLSGTNYSDLSRPKISEEESEKSNQATEDAQENDDLLFEIDAQIAELDASLSKAENEKDTTGKTSEATEELNISCHAVDNDRNIEAEVIKNETKSPLSALDVEMVCEDTVASTGRNVMSAYNIGKTSSQSKLDSLIDEDNTSKTNDIQMDVDIIQDTLIGDVTEKLCENSNADATSKTAAKNTTDIDTSINVNVSINAEDVANSTTILDSSIADANIESRSMTKDNTFQQDTSTTVIEPIEHGLNEPDMMLEIPTQELINIDESLNVTENEVIIVNDNKLSEKDVVEDNQQDSIDISTSVVNKVNTENTLDIDIKTIDEVSNAVECLINTESIERISRTEINMELDKILAPINNELENMGESSIILPAESMKEIVQEPKASQAANINSLNEQHFDSASETKVVETPSIITNTEEPLKGQVQDDKKLDSVEKMDVQPSTKEPDVQPTKPSQMAPDSSDDVSEVTDSLGLLAECSRMAEDDDEQETSDHDEDDDDFDPDDADESSNQLGLDQSEDSAQHSETDAPKPTDGGDDKESDTEGFGKTLKQNADLFDMLREDKKPGEELEPSTSTADDAKDKTDMDVDDDIVCEEVEVRANTLIGDADPAVDAALDATLDAALDATLEPHDKTPKTATDQGSQLQTEECKANKLDDVEGVDISRKTPIEKDSKLTPSSKKETVKEEAIVDLGESSSEDDMQDVKKKQSNASEVKETTSAKIASRINTSEISIKTTTCPKPPMVIPEAKMSKPRASPEAKLNALQVFNIDSDDEEPSTAVSAEKEKSVNKCINNVCAGGQTTFVPADSSARIFYQCKRRGYICLPCLLPVHQTTEKLVEGIKKFTPLLELEVREREQECVEISDSESEDEADSVSHGDREKIIEPVILERQLADVINATWDKYKFERLLSDAQDHFVKEIERIEKESKEVNTMLDECQTATDKLRNELYASFAVERQDLPALTIFDQPDRQYMCLEAQSEVIRDVPSNKRRLSVTSESKAKRAIPLGCSGAQGNTDQKAESPKQIDSSKVDDDKDVSVVRLSAESPPASLPPAGEPTRAPLAVGTAVFAMRHAFGSWIRARLLEVTPKGTTSASHNFTMCRVKFDNKTNRNVTKVLPARCLAYSTPSDVRMTIGTRVIALFKAISSEDNKEPKRESFYSGVVAEIPNPVNKYRYLVFFDDGYAQYVQHADTRLVCEFSSLVWEEVHSFSREFVKEYLLAYPERPMVRLHTGQNLKTEWNGKWWTSRVIAVDASLVQVYFEQDKRTEWIYRGSTRLAPLYLELQAAEKHRARPLPRNRQNKLNMPYVEYTRTDEAEPKGTETAQLGPLKAEQEEMRRQRAVAKKSTGPSAPAHLPPPTAHSDAVPYTSRVVYYTPKNAVKPHKIALHACSPRCRRTDVLSLKDLRTYNPLAKPLLSGWERQISRFKGHKEVAYRAPCGRRIRNMRELHRYLRTINSDMGVDLFDFGPNTHCLAEFVLNKCIVGKKDLSHGKENVPVPCVNYYDDSLPEFCSYNTERTPTAGVPLNLDPDFLCGCDCTDDCEDKSKCACWKLTLEGAHTIGLERDNVGYEYKRLLEPLPSGIYECNVRCKCRSTCLNRVAQHPLQLKLQVFKTANRGWGIRALNDVPKGSFLCIYAGNLLTDATANLDGLNEGDEYLAELDYIEVVEQMKEGYEDDIPNADKKLDKKESGKRSESESEVTESEEDTNSKSDEADGDFQPAYIPGVFGEFSKRLRKRDKKKKKDEEVAKEKEPSKENAEEDCITISDDEEIREPSRFAAQAGMGGEYISKYRSVRSYFGKDEACYIMDAKVQGNIGRYLNHSCSPNVFVQNVFVDTHDPRFPWVAFFALTHIRAGTELTWNYNYDIGSVPGKALYCYCGAANCRGRLL